MLVCRRGDALPLPDCVCVCVSLLCCCRLYQKRIYLQQQQQGPGLQAYFNQMQIAEGSYPSMEPVGPPGSPQGGPSMPGPQSQASPQASPPYGQQALGPLMEPGDGLLYDLYLGPQHPHGLHHLHHHQPHPHYQPQQLLPQGPLSHHHHHHHHPQHHLHLQPQEGASFGGYPQGCEQQQLELLGPSSEQLYPEQYDFSGSLDVCHSQGLVGAPPRAQGEGTSAGQPPPYEGLSSMLDSEMMETVDSQHGFVLVN